MFNAIGTVSLWVHDQNEAHAFYTEKLGLETRADVSLAELGDFRWLTVGVPGQALDVALMAIPGAPVFDDETAGQVRTLMGKGAAGTLFLATDDCRRDYEELKARGVEFSEEPSDRPYGVDAALRDPSGNSIRLVQSTV
jgi:catechol 2,3-dioxygenase-like lactoylglutathione lyase family enzyme